ncbi:ABC-type branched-chain amino acid transport system, permease component [Bradyrhizobium yuanmingense]|uniref:ABC-type branched-chain amino acid transport system, permease component n=1 Tax=Bradyrhizobium yuanmingense TaxID=108015 RepID=A0A1C3WT29_9BRAD|nr:branched-chain amino acid ABC transporter permease [Bradyrhizobium yuanmingense]MCA1384391.1 branched-chain amino acid ABC transporter permease [Bradyrhizobium sp. BRP05]TWI23329.1 branched-chain amino acid transport system permease protein [Bradyrhizobium yuanmingense]SCB42904.1 ABC-type branched-chain amino acid transport system, permease component [Bradyrhizobium yuanmingense]
MPTIIAAAAVLVIALLPVAAPWLQFVLTLAIAKGFAALGVAVLLRAGLISIGHAMFFAASAYAVAFLARAGVNDLGLLLILSVLGGALVGAVAGSFLVRYRAIFFAMLNLAVSMVFYALCAKLYGVTGGTDGKPVPVPAVFGVVLGEPAFKSVLFYLSLGLMVLVGLAVQRYLNSPLGHALSAVHTNEIRLEYLGIPVWAVLLIAYVVSAALAGLGGAIAGFAIGRVVPDFAFWTASGHLVLIAVLGGIGGVPGAFIGALFLELLHSAAVTVTDSWNLIVGMALIIVIMFMPKGIYGLFARKEATGL